MSGSIRSRRNDRKSFRRSSSRKRKSANIASCGSSDRAYRLIGLPVGVTVPTFKDLRYRFCTRSDEEPAAHLGKSLLRLGISGPSDWTGSAVDFIEKGLQRLWKESGGQLADDWFDGSIVVMDTPIWYNDHERNQAGIDEEPIDKLYVCIEFAGAQVLPLGETLNLLETQHPLLPVAWWRVLHGVLSPWMRVYSIEDAEEQAEVWLDDLDEQEREESLYGMVAKEVPACVSKDLRRKMGWNRALRLLQATISSTPNLEIRQLISQLLEVCEISAPYRKTLFPYPPKDLMELFEEWSGPLPGVVLDWTSQGAIRGCFDEEFESIANSGEPFMPSHILPISLRTTPTKLDKQVRRVVGIIADMQKVLHKMTHLIQELNDESIRINRSQPALSAA